MNFKIVSYIVGRIMQLEAVLFMLPLAVSLIYGEKTSAFSFLISALIALAIGFFLVHAT